MPVFVVAIGGCSVDSSGGAAKGAAGPSVMVGGGSVSVGVWSTKSTAETDVAPFRISASPITVGQYRSCVSAGGCTAPDWKTAACSQRSKVPLDGPTYTDDADPSLPVTCVRPDAASRFCKWAGGGRLPTPAEWLLAARGGKVSRFAWGNEDVSCARHWRGQHGPSGWVACDQRPDEASIAAKSPSGMTGVLSTVGELVGRDSTEFFAGCAQAEACMVVSGIPGRIDGVVPVDIPKEHMGAHMRLASFRCAWRSE